MRLIYKHKGLTLLEILFSLVIASMILMYLVPQQLRNTHDQLIDNTVSQMNQLVLAARNYYQDNRDAQSDNAYAWPQTLAALVNDSYLPSASLCSSFTANSASIANNYNNNCPGHQEFALFPADSKGQYDMTVPGAGLRDGNSGGGNFWGVSLTVPTAKLANEIRERAPFATTCPPSELTNGGVCSINSNTVTILVPRPAQWPSIHAQYAQDGLIQSMGSVVICNGNCKNHYSATIDMPSTCGKDPAGNSLVPALFVYPFDYDWKGNSKKFLGIRISQVATNNIKNQWTVKVVASIGNTNSSDADDFNSISIAYFTTCQPHNPTTGSWQPILGS